jgi:hypothetical protein
MLFLVTAENIDPGYLVPPEQTFQIIEQAVIPSFHILAGWVAEGKAKGGTFPGERGGALVVDASSVEELDRMMNQLPFFGLVKWQIKALMPFEAIIQQLPQYIAGALFKARPLGDLCLLHRRRHSAPIPLPILTDSRELPLDVAASLRVRCDVFKEPGHRPAHTRRHSSRRASANVDRPRSATRVSGEAGQVAYYTPSIAGSALPTH